MNLFVPRAGKRYQLVSQLRRRNVGGAVGPLWYHSATMQNALLQGSAFTRCPFIEEGLLYFHFVLFIVRSFSIFSARSARLLRNLVALSTFAWHATPLSAA